MKNSTRILLGTALILLIPLIAMLFTDQVNWGLGDFVVIGALLLGAGFAYEFIANRVPKKGHRIVLALGAIFAVLVIWADLAVGIFNIPGFSGS
ncbi:MAG TPA: hypothetical protein VGB97_04600 [Candidatus Paceibacterota bacterium]|jgi:hypothetical protein